MPGRFNQTNSPSVGATGRPRDQDGDSDVSDGTRGEAVGRMAEAVMSVSAAHPTRVGIDGPPAAGKTTLADELAAVLRARGRDVIRATVDDFLVPRPQRYRRGEFSAEGCYLDAHDHDALNRTLLDPLGPGGDRRYRLAVHDPGANAALSPPTRTARPDAILIFDGVFLMRPELVDRWDVRILVHASLERVVERAVLRERRASSPVDVERRWRERYIPAQQLYVATVRPTEHADLVLYNDEPEHPLLELRAR